jgi:dihydrolipoamide dehydrogenase
VLEIAGNDVVYEHNGEPGRVSGEKVLLAIGRRPNVDRTMLERLGIENDRGRVSTNTHMQTNIPGIYAIGDINGKFMLAHVASEEGITAVDHICGEDSEMSYDAIPQCVYSVPEVAWAGLTEQGARDSGLNIQTGIFPLSANGKSQVEGASAGFVKIIADKANDIVVGVHMVGPHATDMIMEGVLAVKQCMTTGQLVSAIHPHPSVTEAVMEAAMLAQKQFSIHSIPRKKN